MLGKLGEEEVVLQHPAALACILMLLGGSHVARSTRHSSIKTLHDIFLQNDLVKDLFIRNSLVELLCDLLSVGISEKLPRPQVAPIPVHRPVTPPHAAGPVSAATSTSSSISDINPPINDDPPDSEDAMTSTEAQRIQSSFSDPGIGILERNVTSGIENRSSSESISSLLGSQPEESAFNAEQGANDSSGEDRKKSDGETDDISNEWNDIKQTVLSDGEGEGEGDDDGDSASTSEYEEGMVTQLADRVQSEGSLSTQGMLTRTYSSEIPPLMDDVSESSDSERLSVASSSGLESRREGDDWEEDEEDEEGTDKAGDGEESGSSEKWQLEEDVLGLLKAVALYGCLSSAHGSMKLIEDILLVRFTFFA
jgi:hypothetical protein